MRLAFPGITIIILLAIVASAISPTSASTVTLNFRTSPSGASITFDGVTYQNGASGSFDTSISHTATANTVAGYAFKDWIPIQPPAGNTTTICLSVSNPHTPTTTVSLSCGGGILLAEFDVARQIAFNTNPSSGVSITWTPTGWPQGINYTNGQSDHYVSGWYAATANPLTSGDTFSYWTGAGGLYITSGSIGRGIPDPCHSQAWVDVSASGSLGAVFNPPSPPIYGVTFLFNSTMGSVTFDGTSVYNGTTLSYARGCHAILASPAGPYVFDSWLTTSGLSLTNQQTGMSNNTILITGNGTLTANFGLPIINYTINPAEGGTITFNGKSYYGGHSDRFKPGTPFTATAIPTDSNYSFSGWTAYNGVTLNSASTNPTTGTVSSSGTLIATFAVQNICGPNCSIQVNSTAEISNIQYSPQVGQLSFKAAGLIGSHADHDISVKLPLSTGIKISLLQILVNSTPPPLTFTYTCDTVKTPSPCTAGNFYTVTFTVHLSIDYILFYLRGPPNSILPSLALIGAVVTAPLLALFRRRQSGKRFASRPYS